jgi:hypothetical protein
VRINGQPIQITHIHLPSNDNLTWAKNVYLDLIDEHLLPLENELNQLIIFIQGESIILPADRWSCYGRKDHNTQWIKKLELFCWMVW